MYNAGLSEVPQPQILSGCLGGKIAHVKYKVCAMEPNTTEA